MQHILITGASSGLGAALALALSNSATRLLLTGRDAERLRQVAHSCESRGAAVVAETIDVGDRARMRAFASAYPVDLAIANAGISAGTAAGLEPEAQTEAIFRTNVEGVLNTIEPVIPGMKQRARGQIAIISSLASFKGFPGAPAYCASKAAVRFLGEAWRPLLRHYGIRVSVVCPGFIKTPMTDANHFHMPMLMTPEEAAAIILQGLERNKGRIAFPLPLYAASWLSGALPPSWVEALLSWLPAKPAAPDAQPKNS